MRNVLRFVFSNIVLFILGNEDDDFVYFCVSQLSIHWGMLIGDKFWRHCSQSYDRHILKHCKVHCYMQIRDSSDLFILFYQSRASVFAFATMPFSRILLTLRPLRIPFPGVRVVRRQRNSALYLLFFPHLLLLLLLHIVFSCFQHRWSRRCVGICHVGEKPQREQTQVSLIVRTLLYHGHVIPFTA